MGSVMSAQSVAIETFRHIRSSGNGSGEIVAYVAPTVATQMDFWYEEECEDLARRLGHPIHVRVDPMLHPEKSRIDLVRAFNEASGQVVRVGDEHEVELLPGSFGSIRTSKLAAVWPTACRGGERRKQRRQYRSHSRP